MKTFLIFVEKAFVVFSLLFFLGCFYSVAATSDLSSQTSQNSPVLLAIQSVIQALSLLLIIARWKSSVITAIRGKVLWLLLGLALVSFLWSNVSDFTLRRSLVLLGTSWFGLYLAARYRLKEQLHLLAWALGIAALLSVVVTLAFPSFGLMSKMHHGAWRGIFQHKNPLGRAMDLGALVFLLLAISTRTYLSYIMWAGFGLSVSLVLLSTSKTALVLLLTLLLLLPLYKALRWNYTLVLPFFITIICVSAGTSILLMDNWENILAGMGREATFTGRTVIWTAVLDKIWEHPWLGYGFAGFWGSTQEELLNNIVLRDAAHSHNGFLDLWLNLGLLGLLLFLLTLLAAYSRAVYWARFTKTAPGLWPLMFLTFLFLSNLSEISILDPSSIFWVLYVTVYFSLFEKMNENL